MARIMRHRQTKEPDTDRPSLNHRATSRLYPCGQNGFWIYAKSPCIESAECPALKRVFCSIAPLMPRRVYVPAQRGEREDSYARPDRFSAGEVGKNPDHVQTVGKFQKGVKYIVPFFMRMTAGPCPRTPSFPDFHQEFFFARLRPDSAPARMTGLNLLCAVALPGMIYPEDTAFKSTRPPEPGSPATDLRRWGGASGDPVRD
jgi:hypothetical protein